MSDKGEKACGSCGLEYKLVTPVPGLAAAWSIGRESVRPLVGEMVGSGAASEASDITREVRPP